MKSKKKQHDRYENWGRILGVFYVLAWLVYIMFRTTGGDLRSLLSFLPAGIMLLLMLVANQNQIIGGIALLGSGVVIGIRYSIGVPDAGQQVINGFITGGPFVLVGFLYLISGLQKQLKPNNPS